MNLGAIEVTDRKFMDYVKIISIDSDSDNSKIIIDNSEKYDGSDIVEIIVGIENKFLMSYFKVCMDNGMVCNLEVNNDNVLICGFVDVKVNSSGDGSDSNENDNNGSLDKFIIEPVVKSKNIPDNIEVDINDVSEEYKEYLRSVLSDSMKIDKSIGVGLVCEEYGNVDVDRDKWFIECVKVNFKR